jgi:hypothetical protein
MRIVCQYISFAVCDLLCAWQVLDWIISNLPPLHAVFLLYVYISPCDMHRSACPILTRFIQAAFPGGSLQGRDLSCDPHDCRKSCCRVCTMLDGKQWNADVSGARADGEQEASGNWPDFSRAGSCGLDLNKLNLEMCQIYKFITWIL